MASKRRLLVNVLLSSVSLPSFLLAGYLLLIWGMQQDLNKQLYHNPDDDNEPSRSDNESEDLDKDPWKCICGLMGQDDTDTRPAVYCEACCTWQHRGCLALPFFGEDADEHHYCYRCVPQVYVELRQARARGERPWERNLREYEV